MWNSVVESLSFYTKPKPVRLYHSFLLHLEPSYHSLSAFYTESFEHLPGSCHHISDMVRVTVKEFQILNSLNCWMQSVIMFGSDVRKFGLVRCVYLAILLFIQFFLGENRKSSDIPEIIHLDSFQFESMFLHIPLCHNNF